MNNPFEKFVANIEAKGLPSVAEMRADLEMLEIEKLQISLQSKFSEYTTLFNRFKEGGDLSDAECERMTYLSDKFSRLGKSLKKSPKL